MEVLCGFHGDFLSPAEGAVSRFTTGERRWDGLSSGNDVCLMEEVTLWADMSGGIYCLVLVGWDWCRLWLDGKKRKNSGRKWSIFRARCGVCFVVVKKKVERRKWRLCWESFDGGFWKMEGVIEGCLVVLEVEEKMVRNSLVKGRRIIFVLLERSFWKGSANYLKWEWVFEIFSNTKSWQPKIVRVCGDPFFLGVSEPPLTGKTWERDRKLACACQSKRGYILSRESLWAKAFLLSISIPS